MPPRGRPPSSRGVAGWRIEADDAPRRVLLDTSLVVEATITGQPLHADARGLLALLAGNSVEIVFSRLLFLELAETAYKIAARESASRKNAGDARADGRVRRRAKGVLLRADAAWFAFLDTVAWQCIEVHTVPQRLVVEVMHEYGLRSYDALHAGAAHFAGCDAIATKDNQFADLPERTWPRLLVPDSSITACRRRRALARTPTYREA